jgi:hypothetical protein
MPYTNRQLQKQKEILANKYTGIYSKSQTKKAPQGKIVILCFRIAARIFRAFLAAIQRRFWALHWTLIDRAL